MIFKPFGVIIFLFHTVLVESWCPGLFESLTTTNKESMPTPYNYVTSFTYDNKKAIITIIVSFFIFGK